MFTGVYYDPDLTPIT